MTALTKLWWKKYAPKTLSEVVFQNQKQKVKFLGYVKDKEFPHLLLSGVQGSGKSSISQALSNDIGIDPIDILTVKAAVENNADSIRTKITSFCQSYSSSKFKIIRLEESDFFSPAAQGALRNLTEDYADFTRFIFTCNYPNKIMPALKSRLTHYEFKAPAFDDSVVLIAEILVKESIDFTADILQKYLQVYYPDLRALLNALQENSKTGKLEEPDATADKDYKFELIELFNSGDLAQIRSLVTREATTEEYEDIYRFMYENLESLKGFKKGSELYEIGIAKIAKFLYQHAFVAAPDINFAGLCSELIQCKSQI